MFFNIFSTKWYFFQFGSSFLILLSATNHLSFNAVELLLYSPNRPIVDFSVVFLWLMAVGTIVCASLWSEFTGSKKNDERYNELSPKVLIILTSFVLKIGISASLVPLWEISVFGATKLTHLNYELALQYTAFFNQILWLFMGLLRCSPRGLWIVSPQGVRHGTISLYGFNLITCVLMVIIIHRRLGLYLWATEALGL